MQFYSDPPDLNPGPKVRPRRRDELSTDSTWNHIDQIVDDVDGATLEPSLEPECEGVLTPTMKIAETLGLLYSGDEFDGENSTGSDFEWESDRSEHNKFPKDSGTGRGDGNSNRPASTEGSDPDHPVIIEDDQRDTDSEDELPSLVRLKNRRRDLGREGNVTRADDQVVDSRISSAVRLDDGRHSPPAIVDVADAGMAGAAVTHDATVPEQNYGSGRDPSVDGTSISDTEHGDWPGYPDIASESDGGLPSSGPIHIEEPIARLQLHEDSLLCRLDLSHGMVWYGILLD
ncbi:hypothetical protein LTR66_004133 [Elasticomyces elasticus]|nr:hypothetical protein LTR66_004133 [Elasticomyces elasticus]